MLAAELNAVVTLVNRISPWLMVLQVVPDCDACRPVCPVNAIEPDSEPDLEQWLKVNADLAKRWPRIMKKKDRPADADKWAGVSNKFQKYFDPRPAEG